MRKSPRLRVFISSRMAELQPERELVRAELDKDNIDAWVFEKDAGSRPESIQQTFLKELGESDLYIGIFWRGYGPYTIEEYEYAREQGIPTLIYEKRLDIENRRDPELQDFLKGIGDVESGHTIQWFNTPEELAECLKTDINVWLVKTARQNTAPVANANLLLSLPEKRERDAQLNLLQKVKLFWIDGLLKQSVHQEALLALQKQPWTENAHPWQQTIEVPDPAIENPLNTASNLTTFDQSGRSLLILGEPGSGKTMTLLDLALQLIRQAEKDPTKAIPVVFNLSTWSPKHGSMLHWMIDELNGKYQIPKSSAEKWLKENNIIPLLDGLDEVRMEDQTDCVTAINQLINSNMLPGIAVTSRTGEYQNIKERLQLSLTIQIQPLSPEQIDDYVARAGTRLEGLRQVLKSDDALKALAQSPLMLDVMALAYGDMDAASLADKNLQTPEARRKHLFDTYVDKMFKRKGEGKRPYSQQQMTSWLAWLADGMQRHNQSVFFVHQLEADWLTESREVQKLNVVQAFTSLFINLVFRQLFTGWLGEVLLFLLGPNIQFSLDSTPENSYLQLNWSRQAAVSSIGRQFLRALLPASIFIALYFLARYRGFEPPPLAFGLLLFTYVMLNTALGSIFNGFSKAPLKPEQAQDISNIVLKNLKWLGIGGILAGALIGLVFGALINSLINGNSLYVSLGAIEFFALFSAIVLFTWYVGGFALKNFTMLISIYLTGNGPFGYFAFLEYASRLAFLRKVGIGYIFIHRLVLEHFAKLRHASQPTSARHVTGNN